MAYQLKVWFNQNSGRVLTGCCKMAAKFWRQYGSYDRH